MNHTNFLSAPKCARDVLEGLSQHLDAPVDSYAECLTLAFDGFSPVFTQPPYADFYLQCTASVPAWIPSNILANAKKESDGSRLLFELWRRVHNDAALEDDVLYHVRDEVRHSKLFVTLAELSYPSLSGSAVISDVRSTLFSLDSEPLVKASERLSDQDILDHLVQMNLGEIRTRVHISMIAPLVSAVTPPVNRAKVEKLLASLVSDETAHVAYTARHIERFCAKRGTDEVASLFKKRLRDLHDYTIDETRTAVSAYAPEMSALLN